MSGNAGMKILKDLQAAGLELPSSSAKKGKPKPVDEKSQVEDHTELIKQKLGTDFRKKIEIAFKADLEAKKLELEKIRLND